MEPLSCEGRFNTERKFEMYDENDFSKSNAEPGSIFEYTKYGIDQKISSDIRQKIIEIYKFLKTAPEKNNLQKKINQLRDYFIDNQQILSNHPTINIYLPIDEIIFDLFMNELLENSDIHLFFSFICLFDSLLPIYQEQISDTLILSEFFENILAVLSDQNDFGIENFRQTVLIFSLHLILVNQSNITQSQLYFDDLYAIASSEVKENESEVLVLMNFLEYIQNLLYFNSDFICSKKDEVSNLIQYVSQRPDFPIFMKLVYSILLNIFDFCFEPFADFITQLEILRIDIDTWASFKDISYQTIFLKIIQKSAQHKIISDSRDTDLSLICEFVFSFYQRPNEETQKQSWMATFSLIKNYPQSMPLFLSQEILGQIIEICQSAASYENKKEAVLVLFYLLFHNNEILNPVTYEDIHEIFYEYHDLKLVNDDIIHSLELTFDNYEKNQSEI